MSQNKKTVQTFMDAFNISDHAALLSCLTDDIEWVIPGTNNVCPGGNGVFRPTIVASGQVIGLWKRKEAAKKAQLELAPFDILPARLGKAIDAATSRYAAFLGKPVSHTSTS